MMWIVYALAAIGALAVAWLLYGVWHWLFREEVW